MKTFRSHLHRQSGVAIIEFALLLLFLLLLAVGITEIGRAFWYYSVLQKSSRDAARCISQVEIGNNAAVTNCVDLAVADAVTAGVQPKPVSGEFTVTYDDNTTPEYVTVAVSHNMHWIWSPSSSLPSPGTGVPMNIKTTMPYLY